MTLNLVTFIKYDVKTPEERKNLVTEIGKMAIRSTKLFTKLSNPKELKTIEKQVPWETKLQRRPHKIHFK